MNPLPIAGAGTLAAGSFLAWAVRGRSSCVFGASHWRGNPCRPAVALTFDDGPSESTAQILDILARHKVRATFFQCGANVDRLPSVAREVAAAGHLIGNHSYAHPLFCFRSSRFIENDLRRAQESIHAHTGTTPSWFRAPFGVRWFGMRRAQQRLNLMGVMWSAIGYDWSQPASRVVVRLAGGAGPGAILCLHDGRELNVRPDVSATVAAVEILIPMLLDRGYLFETVTDLLCPTS